MTDAEYIIRSEAREHKANGRAIYSRASRGGGKSCRLPSDNLTKAQLKKMNGEMTTLKMNKPIPWKEFKKCSLELQREYIENLVEKYGARQADIAQMFEVNRSHLNKHLAIVAPGLFANHRKKGADPRWIEFIKENIVEDQTIADTGNIAEETKIEKAPVVADNSNDNKNSEPIDLDVNTLHGNVTFKGEPYAVFARAVKMFDEGKKYTIIIGFREEEEDAEERA